MFGASRYKLKAPPSAGLLIGGKMGILNWLQKVGEVAAENDQNLHHYFYDAGIPRNSN
jgi:hypothetical protein